MNWRYLRSEPTICNGRVHIAATRITVRRALEAMALYPDRNELRREFPELTDDVLREILDFAAMQIGDDEFSWPRAA